MSQATGRRWGAILGLTLVTVVFSVVRPSLLLLVPLGLLLLALPPRRPVLMLLGLAMAAASLAGPRADAFWYAERGYALVLGAWFVLMAALRPGAPFLSNALRAVAGTLLTAAPLFVFDRGGWAQLDWTVTARLRSAAAQMAAAITAGRTDSDMFGPQFTESLYRAADVQALVYPALLALASVAALGLAWWAFRRLTAEGATQALAPLRDFRFRDELVWVMIVGVVLVVLPLGQAGMRTGSNLLAFMGALYALRGVAVMVALVGTPGMGGLLLAALAMFFLPLVMVATLVVGLTDTWLDLRARRREEPT